MRNHTKIVYIIALLTQFISIHYITLMKMITYLPYYNTLVNYVKKTNRSIIVLLLIELVILTYDKSY